MRSPRTLLILVLLGLALGAERFAYYGSRTFAALDLRESLQGYERVSIVFTLMTWASIAGLAIGASAAYFVGPRITAVIGAGVSALGLALLGFADSPVLGWGVVGFGSGIFRFCPWAAAGQALATDKDVNGVPFASPRRFMSMAAFATAAYVMSNISAALSSPIMGAIRTAGGRSPATAVSVVFLLTAAALIGGAELVVRGDAAPPTTAARPDADPYRSATPATVVDASPMTTFASTGLTGLAVLAIGEVFLSLGASQAGMPPSSMLAADIGWLFSINPAIVILTNIVFFVVFLVGALNRSRSTPLVFFAAGTLVTGLGFILALLGQSTIVLFAFAQVVIAAGEIAFPIALAYAALSVRGRGVSFAVAFFMATSSIVSVSTAPLMAGGDAGRMAVLVLAAIGAIVCGAVFLGKTRRLHHYFEDPASPSTAAVVQAPTA